MSKPLVTLTRLSFLGVIVLLACNLPTRIQATPAATQAGPTSTPAPTAGPLAKPGAAASPVQITGVFSYTNDIINVYYSEHAIALVDLYGFVKRDPDWEIPVESQTLGFLTLDEEAKKGQFWLQLPAKPSGTLADVGQDDQANSGVQIFAVTYWPNLVGGPYSEGDDPTRGWPNYLASVKIDTENKDEVTGGKLVVWAPDDQQHFPTGFGADGLLFTPDDPVGPIPAGYSIVDLDQKPFAVTREAEPELTLYEPADIALKDYSALSYTEAFEALFAKVSTEWAFNGIPGKEVDWQALHDDVAPRVAQAEKDRDALGFYQALHAFILSIPDGHTSVDGGDLSSQDFFDHAGGGYGLAIRQLDDGKVIVVYVSRGGPGEQAGIKIGAEVTQFNGEKIAQAIEKVEPYLGPFSLQSTRHEFQEVFLLRNPVDTEASLTFTNPGSSSRTVTLTSVLEIDSLLFALGLTGEEDLTALPVEARVLDSGIGYIKITSNYDDLGLILRLFERALKALKDNNVTDLIIDLRRNSGGAPLGLAGFLHDREIRMGQLEYYSEETGQFEPEGTPDKVMPYTHEYRFDKIAVLVGRDCASACELEAYGFSKIPGAVVVGMHSTAGVEAEVARGQFTLPEGITVRIPTGRFVNPDGSLFLEGTGVVPTVKVPVTQETVLATDDVELRAAEDAIFGVSPDDLKLEGGPTLGAPATSEAALSADTPFLESLAVEQYDSADFEQVGRTYTYTVTLDGDRRLMWQYGWCATTASILDDNYQHMSLAFSVNGTPIDLDQFAVIENTSDSLYCRSYYMVVYRWPSGETRLEAKVTFKTKVNDGLSDYPPGSQSFVYLVTRP